jgi:Ca2+-transporting ATPase
MIKSITQGIFVLAASFGLYLLVLNDMESNATTARAMGLTVIMLANLFLVQVNSSEYDFALTSIRRLAKDRVMWLINIGTLLMIAVILYSPLSGLFKLAPLTMKELLAVIATAFVSVFWIELVKLFYHLKAKTN